jgi:ABC-type transporter Mla subunit MlaD
MRSAAQRAIENVREFGAQMGARAQALRAALPNVRMAATERNRALELCDQLSAVADEVASGVAGLDAINAKSEDEVQEVLHTLSTLEAQAMEVLAALSFLVESLEQAAERDEANEPAYALVIDAAAGLLNSFEKAKSATETLRAALSRRIES